MTAFMHAASAPMFTVLLNNLNAWLDKAEALAAAKKFDIDVLLGARLAPDMFPLHGQINICTAFAKNTMCRLAGDEAPDFTDDTTLPQLRARIARTLDIVQSYAPAALEGAETRQMLVQVGPDMKVSFTGITYLFNFALPNFYFHLSTAYDILRHNGVDLGKKDLLIGAFEVPGAR